MRLYPAIRAKMGDWTYYIVRMKMREIAHEVQLAHDIYEDNTLSDAVQRTLAEHRVKKEIVGYLARRPDRFFSSIVVAAMEGAPMWSEVTMDEDVVPGVIAQSKPLSDAFGILSFGEEPKYYALDGQHRVAAIKLLVNGDAGDEFQTPDGFFDDMLSVIVVLREEHDVPEGEWMRRYRRLFSSLNRYARPTDIDTNIIMDEDDLFAILTRRLITDHPFFQAPGRQKDSYKVKTKGKALKSGDSFFITLQTLYVMNERLLSPRARQQADPISKQVRPSEDLIDERYEELSNYWDAILMALPELRESPAKMRHHTKPGSDHLLFWPIGQEFVLGPIVRDILDDRFKHQGFGGVEEMAAALAPLDKISWQLHNSPWRHLMLVRDPSRPDSWRMRSEERKDVSRFAHRLLRWAVCLDNLDSKETQELYDAWTSRLMNIDPTVSAHSNEIEEMWEQLNEMRLHIAATS